MILLRKISRGSSIGSVHCKSTYVHTYGGKYSYDLGSTVIWRTHKVIWINMKSSLDGGEETFNMKSSLVSCEETS